MCRIKFQGEYLETFLVYDVGMGAINAHSRVAGSSEPARSVSVNFEQVTNVRKSSDQVSN